MFTGIVQGVGRWISVVERTGLRTVTLEFPPSFAQGLEVGASVACDGVCLTVTEVLVPDRASFDVMQQTLALTTLGSLRIGDTVNVERAAREGVEIGGHPISGHVDVQAEVIGVRQPENNHVLRLAVPTAWMRYIFAKGYVAINGASLTVADADRRAGWFEVWLIPETLRMTTFGAKAVGHRVNIEIERSTQVLVDTVREALDERLAPLMPALNALLEAQGQSLEELGLAPPSSASAG